MKRIYLILLALFTVSSPMLTALLVYSTPFTVDYSSETQIEVWKESIPYYLFKIGYRRLWSYHPVDWTPDDFGWYNITFSWSVDE